MTFLFFSMPVGVDNPTKKAQSLAQSWVRVIVLLKSIFLFIVVFWECHHGTFKSAIKIVDLDCDLIVMWMCLDCDMSVKMIVLFHPRSLHTRRAIMSVALNDPKISLNGTPVCLWPFWFFSMPVGVDNPTKKGLCFFTHFFVYLLHTQTGNHCDVNVPWVWKWLCFFTHTHSTLDGQLWVCRAIALWLWHECENDCAFSPTLSHTHGLVTV